MSRNKTRKPQIRSIMEATGKRARGAANILNREQAARLRAAAAPTKDHPVADGTPVFVLDHVYEGAERLFQRRPEGRVFTTSLFSLQEPNDSIGPNGEVHDVPLLEIRFVQDTPAHWWFDGLIAFIENEVYDGNRPASAGLLGTAGGRSHLASLITNRIRRDRPELAKRLTLLVVKSGHQRGDNLVVRVSLAFVDPQERDFGDLLVALQRADTLASIEMSKGGLNLDLDTVPKREAIAAARAALALLERAAETPQQKAAAVRARGHERTWRLWEESLERIEARRKSRS